MSNELTVYYRDGEQETKNFPENLYDLPWPKYRKLERKLKANAELDRNGDIQKLNIASDDMGDFIVEIQEELAKMVLETQDVDINDVTTRTVKTVIQEYGDGMEELGMKLKKKEGTISSLVELWNKGHKPNVNDQEIQESVKLLNMMDAGMQIPVEKLSALEVKHMQLIKAKTNDKQREDMVDA